jgi:uncharacterized protein (DUF427 family)
VGTRVRDVIMGSLDGLRYEYIDKRIRATLAGETVIDTAAPMLVWEPKRVTPSYAVPESDVSGSLTPAASRPDAGEVTALTLDDRPILDPSIPFIHHSSDGESLDVTVGEAVLAAAAFRVAAPVLEGYVVVDFDAFEEWYEEEERNYGHPRDPYHRIEILHSGRHVRVEHEGALLADTRSPYILYESMLPVRYYLPLEDVNTDVLGPSESSSICAYKGHASYLALTSGEDVAWTYHQPQREASEVRDRVAFFSERVDFIIDGTLLGRPVTPWSPRER